MPPKKPKKLDRGRQRGAKWFVVAGRTLYTKALADQHGIKGILFRSGKEAKRWISLLNQHQTTTDGAGGSIRNLRRQVRYPLQARRPDGLMETVAHYVADFVYEERTEAGEWAEVVEDTKPSGFKLVRGKKVPFREEVYALKKRWFETQYGVAIRET